MLTQVADNVSTARDPWPTLKVTEGHGTVSADGASFTGSVSYLYTFNDAVVCDIDVALSGTSASAICDACVFAFDIDATITEDNSIPGCEVPSWVDFVPVNGWTNLKLGFAEDYDVLAYFYGDDGGYYDWETLHDVLVVGASLDYRATGGPYRPGPYWFATYYDAPYWDRGSASWDGSALAWGNTVESTYQGIAYYDHCLTAEWSEATQFYPGTTVSGELTCAANTLDGWAVDASCGDTLSMSVDTVDGQPGFDPFFWVNGPDGCAVVRADDNAICTLGYEAWGDDATPLCPSAQFVVPETGTYTIWLMSTGYWCNIGSVVQYTLAVGRDP